MKRPVRIGLAAAAFAALSLALSACIVLKPGSVKPSQPGGIGEVHLDFTLCNATDDNQNIPCAADNYEGEAQVLMQFLLPIGSTNVPDELTATPPGPGVKPLVFHRDQHFTEATEKYAIYQRDLEPFGYVSEVTTEKLGDEFEWTSQFHFDLPKPADGSSFAGPLHYLVGFGWRKVNASEPASRPVECESETTPGSECSSTSDLEFGVSDLRIRPNAEAAVFPGGTVAVPYTLDFGSTAGAPPSSFALSAATTLPGGVAAPAELTFAPGPLDANRHSIGQRQVNVQVPAKAKAGTYQVQLTATTATGGSSSAVAQLQVKAAKVGVKAKLNKAKGTALLTLKVPAAGTLTVAGKGVVKVQRKAKGPQTLKVTVKAKGKAKKKLLSSGKAKVSAKIKFQPTGAAAVTQKKPLTLKLAG